MDRAAIEQLVVRITTQVGRAFAANEDVVRLLVTALLARGHVLLDGSSGVGKTLLARVFIQSLGFSSLRLQLSADLKPSEVLATGRLVTAHLLLVDELNRGTPRAQAALLQALDERSVTVDGAVVELPDPFWVIATTNSEERVGAFPLPDELVERFFVTGRIERPATAVEEEMGRRFRDGLDPSRLDDLGITPATSPEELKAAQAFVSQTHVEDSIIRYATSLAAETRAHAEIERGASPRATLALIAMSRALAVLEGREFVIPDDVKSIALPVFRSRLLLTPEAEIGGVEVDGLVRQILERVRAPGAGETVRPSRLRTSPLLSEPPGPRTLRPSAAPLPTPPLAESSRPGPSENVSAVGRRADSPAAPSSPSPNGSLQPTQTTNRPHTSPLAREPGEDR
ncbi:MAG: MoxR family ATPase [Deltaproteobacteria bacterium]|nr:MoxR family ATPase [Deltaproteobacteria bacterium]